MKKITVCLLFFCVLLLTGCSSTKYIERVNTLDYKQYSEAGFFITESNSVNFDYTPLGSVTVSIYAGDKGSWYYENGKMYNDSRWVSPSKALNKAVIEARQLGANALLNLKIIPSSINLTGITQYGIILTGMAVKR